MNEKIIELIREKGILLQREIYDLLVKFDDLSMARDFLELLERASGQKMINSSNLRKHTEYVITAVNNLPSEMKQLVETTFIKLGITIEIQQTKEVVDISKGERKGDFRVFYSDTKNIGKVVIGDFVGHFRARYGQIQRMLMQRDVQGLVSIGKINKERRKFSIIGMVSEKRVTGNKNIIVKFEDLTGKVSGFVRYGSECFQKVSELQLDDVVLVKASGNNELIYIYDIIYPDSYKDKVNFESDEWIVFLSDVHVGSKKHLGKEFESFLSWLESDNDVTRNIKYIFFIGDNVDGVGVFPGQEKLLVLKSLKEQYGALANYLRRIPKEITIFMCPGQHDSVRVAEPQPMIDRHYGQALYEIQNLVLVSNPSLIKLLEGDKEFKVLMYHGASIHNFINEIEELRIMKAHKCPAKAVRQMLKRRHLAPSHGVSPSIVYIPNNEKDPLVIEEVPDILCTGEVHRLDVDNYNGTLIITGSCWQSQTDYEEKVGNEPDPCKVPIFNLKTRELRILDFGDKDGD